MSEREFYVGTAVVRLVRGDITDLKVDAVVNAANSSLMGGGGVDGAIHRRGGPRILEECRRIRARDWPKGLPTGKAVVTSGWDLPAKFVIHTVGPVWNGGVKGEPELLGEAYMNSLKLAVSVKARTVGFPSIGTGDYGYPAEGASRIALESVKRFLETEDGLEVVIFVLFSTEDLKTYLEAAQQVFG